MEDIASNIEGDFAFHGNKWDGSTTVSVRSVDLLALDHQGMVPLDSVFQILGWTGVMCLLEDLIDYLFNLMIFDADHGFSFS